MEKNIMNEKIMQKEEENVKPLSDEEMLTVQGGYKKTMIHRWYCKQCDAKGVWTSGSILLVMNDPAKAEHTQITGHTEFELECEQVTIY